VELGSALRQLTMGAVVEKCANLAGALLLLRYLPLADYGALTIAYATYTAIEFVAGLGLSDLVVARCAEARSQDDEVTEGKLLGSYLVWVVGGAAVCAILGLVLRPVLVARLPSEIAPLYLLGLSAGLTTPMRSVVVTMFRMHSDFAGVKRVDIVRSVGLAAGYGVFVGVLQWGLAGGLVAYAFANTLPLLTNLRALAPAGRSARGNLRPAAMLALMRDEGKWQILRYGVATVHANARPWLIQVILGLEAVALFNAAKTILGVAPDLLPIKEALIPLMSGAVADADQLRRLYVDSLRYGTFIFGTMTVGIVLVVPWVFPWLFPQYAGAIRLIQIMALSVVITGITTPQASLFYALRTQQYYFTTTLISLVLLVTLGVPLMLALGVNGMGIAFVASGAIVAWLRQQRLKRECPALALTSVDLLSLRSSDLHFFRKLLLGRRA
jgi:O-antigen/teichoic acid export membrane protein